MAALRLLGVECSSKLFDFNDTDKFSFNQIADIIDTDTSGKNIILSFEKIPE